MTMCGPLAGPELNDAAGASFSGQTGLARRRFEFDVLRERFAVSRSPLVAFFETVRHYSLHINNLPKIYGFFTILDRRRIVCDTRSPRSGGVKSPRPRWMGVDEREAGGAQSMAQGKASLLQGSSRTRNTSAPSRQAP